MLTAVQPSTQTSALELSRATLVETLDGRGTSCDRFPSPSSPACTWRRRRTGCAWRATDGDLALFTQMPVEASCRPVSCRSPS